MSKVYAIVTQQILEQLERGVVPWARPWKVEGLAPANLASRRAYRGINVLLLGLRAATTPWWLTFRQAAQLGGHVRAGERSVPVVFWRWAERTDPGVGEQLLDDQGKRECVPILRYYAVFNLDQTEGIDPAKLPPSDSEPEIVLDAETVVAGYKDRPVIEHRPQPRAFYRPGTDTVTLPPRSAFPDARSYYTTLFHELAHSTGHARRLGRPGFERNHAAPFGSAEYAREELVAELGAAFLCGESGLEPDIPASASYIDSWRQALSKDTRLVVTAAQQAQRAVDFILGRGTDSVDREV